MARDVDKYYTNLNSYETQLLKDILALSYNIRTFPELCEWFVNLYKITNIQFITSDYNLTINKFHFMLKSNNTMNISSNASEINDTDINSISDMSDNPFLNFFTNRIQE